MDLHRFPIPCRLFRLFAFRSLSYPLCISSSSPARQQDQHLRVSSLSHFALSDPHPAPFPPHPIPSLPAPPSGPFRLFTAHTPLVFDHLVVFLSRKRQNRRFGAGGTCKRGRRGHQSKQLPTKHQVAEGARGQKQERDHPDLPRTVDFDVLDVIF